ncbi:MAG: hypothetical protein K2I36_00925, partial [Ureaplasma sp.]|nr:hypothetical protein [Ureaplasma sp.]
NNLNQIQEEFILSSRYYFSFVETSNLNVSINKIMFVQYVVDWQDEMQELNNLWDKFCSDSKIYKNKFISPYKYESLIFIIDEELFNLYYEFDSNGYVVNK